MKKIFLLLLTSVLAASAFANGQSEDERPLNRPELETISLEGTLSFNDYGMPVLEKDGVTYELHVRTRFSEITEVKEGDTIKVEGLLLPQPIRWSNTDIQRVMVEKGSVNGTEFAIEDVTPEDCLYDEPQGRGRGMKPQGQGQGQGRGRQGGRAGRMGC